MFDFYTYFHANLTIFQPPSVPFKIAIIYFYTYFRWILMIFQKIHLFRTCQNRPWDAFLGPNGSPKEIQDIRFWSPGSTVFQNEGGSSSWYRSRFFKNVNGMMVAHPAGTEADFSENVDGMKVAHTAGTETGISKNVNEIRVIIQLVQG